MGAGVWTGMVLPATTILLAEGARLTWTPAMVIAGPPGTAVWEAMIRLEDASTWYGIVEDPTVRMGLVSIWPWTGDACWTPLTAGLSASAWLDDPSCAFC